MNEPSLFAEKLRRWRARHGRAGRMTQDELAALLGVSVDAIGKYERSLSYIRGDLEPRLAERLGWDRDEIVSCREDWETRQRDVAPAAYRVVSQATVDEVFDGSWRKAANAALDLAERAFADLPEGLSPIAEVWQPFYETYHDLWCGILRGDALVAKWGLTVLLPDDEELFRKGLLEEKALGARRVRSTLLPGTYFAYCQALVVTPGEEPAARLLLSSFVDFLERLTARDTFFHGIGTISVSPAGAQVCRDLGMRRIGAHRSGVDFELWELPGEAMAASIFGRKSQRIADAYRAKFPP